MALEDRLYGIPAPSLGASPSVENYYREALSWAVAGKPVLPLARSVDLLWGDEWAEAVVQGVVLRLFKPLVYPCVPPLQVHGLALSSVVDVTHGLTYYESQEVTVDKYLQTLASGAQATADCSIFAQLVLAMLDGEGRNELIRVGLPRLPSRGGQPRRPLVYLKLADLDLHKMVHAADSDCAMWLVQLGPKLWAGMAGDGVKTCTLGRWASFIRQKAAAVIARKYNLLLVDKAESNGLLHRFVLEKVGLPDEPLEQPLDWAEQYLRGKVE